MADQVADIREVMLVSGQKNSFSFKKRDKERELEKLSPVFAVLPPCPKQVQLTLDGPLPFL